MRSRSAYDSLASSTAPAEFDELVKPVWGAVSDYYGRDSKAQSVDVELIAKIAGVSHLNPKRGREMEALVRELWNEEVSVANVQGYIEQTIRDRAGMALASALAGRRPDDELQPALDAFLSARTPVECDADEDTGWAGVLAKASDPAGRLLVSPRILNQYLRGGVVRGHNITIFGRPESGKSALAITFACGFARRGLRVLYIGNEDPIQEVMVRVMSNLTDKTADEMALDPAKYEAEALKAGAANMVLKETAPGTMKEIERLVKIHKPDVIVIDQLRNITIGGKVGSYTELLDKNAQGVRALGKRYGMVTISVTQAGDSANGRPILDMGDVDSSNTGIPGAADLMIGVGVTESLDMAGQRMLTLCKNKIGVVRPSVVVSLDAFRSKLK
jgi:archaellum biogenesis ATPase FlaH